MNNPQRSQIGMKKPTILLIGLLLFYWWIGRFTTVLMGLLILCLTYSLGRRLFNDKVGLWAVICLLFVRTAGVIFVQLTGILLLDLARITRYDMLVPVFGLLALHLYHTAASRPDWWVYTLAGTMAGCAALSYIYGGFWFVALIILSVWQRLGWRSYLGLAEREFVTAVTLHDPTYGTIQILKRSPEQAILR